MIEPAGTLEPDELTLELILGGSFGARGIRISPGALEHQAAVAETYGNPQLAENLRRAAELTAFTDAEVLAFYAALRPGRASEAELNDLATRLDQRGARRCAGLVREALDAYTQRGLLPPA